MKPKNEREFLSFKLEYPSEDFSISLNKYNNLMQIQYSGIDDDFIENENVINQILQNDRFDELWHFLKIFRKEDKDFMYFYMYNLYRETSLSSVFELLINVLRVDQTKNVAMGIINSMWFFENFDLDENMSNHLATLFSALFNVNNELIEVEVEELLYFFLDRKLYQSFKNMGLSKKRYLDILDRIMAEKKYYE